MKKVKGFKSPRSKRTTITLSLLEKHFAPGEEVSRATIVGKKLFSPKHVTGGFKVVASGELTKALLFDAKIWFSESALVAVKKAGCTVPEKA
jgi:ribosomal protein L15